ncbi:MAG: NAD(P)/FAD-dependent oxidoreductase [Caulobacteraceae bacterium]
MAHIVVAGAGLAGAPLAFEMADVFGGMHQITVVSDRVTFDFTPSNPWVASHMREAADVQVDLAPVFSRKGVAFIHGFISKLRPESNALDLADGRTVEYDYLAIATGPELAFDEVPGLGPDGFTQSICRLDHAEKARAAFDNFLKAPGPIVVGAAQGASCFGPAYEFALILDTVLRKKRLRDRAPITFVTSEPYIGHLGLDGVGDTKSMLEGELRDRDIKWTVNARITRVEAGRLTAEEIADDGAVSRTHDLPFAYSMILPAFRGAGAWKGIEGLVNPRGFVLTDKTQRNARYPNIFASGVCVAIPPVGKTPVAVGVPKTGFMIESMSRAVVANLKALLEGREPDTEATWNAVCLADFGDRGVALVAIPQIPPRNMNWTAEGRWVHFAKAAFETYFLDKVRRGVSEPFYERAVMDWLGITKTRRKEPA